jgi:hypothetical protein
MLKSGSASLTEKKNIGGARGRAQAAAQELLSVVHANEAR